MLHTQEVTGSNPVRPTLKKRESWHNADSLFFYPVAI